MSVTKKDVEYIAELAKLNLSENEVESYTRELNDILGYMEKLNELDTSEIEPLSHPVENINVFREDELKTSVSREDAFKNAPQHSEEVFEVPKIINVD